MAEKDGKVEAPTFVLTYLALRDWVSPAIATHTCPRNSSS